jgi:predicted nucleotidyltransferase
VWELAWQRLFACGDGRLPAHIARNHEQHLSCFAAIQRHLKVLVHECVDVASLNIDFGACPMKPSIAFEAHRATIRSVVLRHRACKARVFGSVLHGKDQEGSDLDILMDPTPETAMFDMGAVRHEVLQLLGVHVDVLAPNALPDSFRAKVIAEVGSV